MIDIAILREEPEKVKKAIATKNADPALVDTFSALDSKWRQITTALGVLRARQNQLSRDRKIEEARTNKEEIKKQEQELLELEKEREEVWAQIPNIPSADTPVGKGEEDNVVLHTWGEIPEFDFTPKDYMELGEMHDIIDTERAAKVSGARFGYLKGAAVQLEFALMQFGFETLRNPDVLKLCAEKVEAGYSARPFIPVVPPVMIRPDVYRKMARLDAKTEEERYYLPKDDLYLIGSAEHTLGAIHMDEILPEEQLPIRYAGFSVAFRREAGSYGKDTRGILRVHQFDKLEMESFTNAENSTKEQNFIVHLQEYMMQQLGLPYRVIICSTGDQGDPDTRHLDIETWFPAQEKYRETHSADLTTDYQARRLNTRMRRAKDGKNEFVHMNDATVFSQRPILAILENFQTKDGKIIVPKVLHKYGAPEVIG
jgi:seryl-tRNA synthetase